MKKTSIYFLLATIIFFSCEEKPKKIERKHSLIVINGTGLSEKISEVKCDSFYMQSTQKAIFWVDGQKMNIEANNVIYPHTR